MIMNHIHSQYSPVSKPSQYFGNLGKMLFLSAEDIREERDTFFKCEVMKSHSQLNPQSGS